MAADRHVAIVGLPGAGKSTVGQALATRLDRPFVDTDERIEAATEATIAELWDARGEAGFRAVEVDVVAATLDDPRPSVVGLGGGAVTSAATRAALADRAWVVWLDAPPEVLARRLEHDPVARPVVAGPDPVARLAALDRARRSLYEVVADLHLDADGPVAEVVDQVAAGLATAVTS